MIITYKYGDIWIWEVRCGTARLIIKLEKVAKVIIEFVHEFSVYHRVGSEKGEGHAVLFGQQIAVSDSTAAISRAHRTDSSRRV